MVVIVDSRLFYEAKEVFEENGVEVRGRPGLNLEGARFEINQHYYENEERYNGILYKVCVGINNFLCKIEDNTREIYQVVGMPYWIKIEDIKEELSRLWAISSRKEKAYVSVCHVQSANLRMNFENKVRKGMFRFELSVERGLGSQLYEEKQFDLEDSIDTVNEYIKDETLSVGFIDKLGNKRVGDIINRNKSIKNKSKIVVDGKEVYKKKYIKRSYGRLTDGIHLNVQYQRKTAEEVVKSMQKEVAHIKRIVLANKRFEDNVE